MSEQIKADFARAQKFIKAEQYAQAITILQPHKEHPRIAALIADLEAKRKPKDGIWITAIWVTVVIIVAVIAGAVGYTIGENRGGSEYELPTEFNSLFVDICTANADLTANECSAAIRGSWKLYQKKTLDCFSLYLDTDMTDGEFLQCIAHADE